MIKKATAALALLALCGLAPAAAQEPQAEPAAKAETMAKDAKKTAAKAETMAEDAEKKAEMMAGEAEKKAAKAEEMAGETMAAAGPSLEKVLADHYEALGGTDAWKAIESVRFEGTMMMGPGMEAPFTMTMKRPNKIRLEFSFQGMTGIQASDGETAWMVMPFMGKTEPDVMPADMAEQFEEQADIEGPLFDWKEKGHELKLVGAEKMEGTDVYKLELTLKNGDVRYHYLDDEYFLTIKQEGKATIQGQEMEIETAIGDYKQLCLATSEPVGDATPCEGDVLMMPHSIESKPKGAPSGQTISITSVAINPGDIEDDLFAMPAKEKAPAEGSAAGS